MHHKIIDLVTQKSLGMNQDAYRINTGRITILSGIVALLCYVLIALAINFRFEFFSNPAAAFSIPGLNIGILRWSMIADIFGYYLLLLPALFYLHDWMATKTPWRKVITFSGALYILFGCMGAAILAVMWPMYLTQLPQASPEQQIIIKLLFESFTAMVVNGIWNLLEVFLAGIWWIGIGVALKGVHRGLGWTSLILGFVSLLDSLGNMFELHLIAEIGLNIYLLLAPVWAIMLGVSIMRNKIGLQ